MQLLVVLTLVLSVLYAHPLHREWRQWKVQHGRMYRSAVEERKRRDVWIQNYDYIHKHNRKHPGFKLAHNQFADMVSSFCSYFSIFSKLDPCNRHDLILCFIPVWTEIATLQPQTQKEFQEQYLSSVNVSSLIKHDKKHVRENNTYPSWMDWRLSGFVTEVSYSLHCNKIQSSTLSIWLTIQY